MERSRVPRIDPPIRKARAAWRGRIADVAVEANISAVSGAIVVRELGQADLPSAVGIVARGMRDNPLHIAALGSDTGTRGATG